MTTPRFHGVKELRLAFQRAHKLFEILGPGEEGGLVSGDPARKSIVVGDGGAVCGKRLDQRWICAADAMAVNVRFGVKP
jgi:hypothetical protein